MKKLLLVLMIGMMGVKGYGQIMFQKTYGGIGNDWGNSVRQTTDGGYIIAGYTSSYGAGNNDVYLIKTNNLGDTLWTKTYGGIGDDEANSVQQTSDGGYIIIGSTSSFGNGGTDVYLIKTDSIGDTLFTKTYGDSLDDVGYSVKQTLDGGYIISGSINCTGPGYGSIYLIKTTNTGDTLWTKIIDPSGNFTGNYWGLSISQTSDGGYIISGITNILQKAAYLLKTDSVGNIIFIKSFIGVGNDFSYSIEQTFDGGYIIVGSRGDIGNGDVYIIKIDSSGNMIFTKAYGDNAYEVGKSIEQISDGGYIIVGATQSIDSSIDKIYLLRINQVGDTLWTRIIGESYTLCSGTSVHQTNDGGFIISGVREDTISGVKVYLIKTDSNGYSGCYETCKSLTVSIPSPTIFTPATQVTYGGHVGYTTTQISNGVIVTSLCSNSDGIQEPSIIKSEISLYPNPTSGTFTLSQLGKRNYKLGIYDVLGQEVYHLAIINQESTIINLPQLSNGVYFYQLSNSKETFRGKFVKE